MKFTIRNKLITGFLMVLLLLGVIVGVANYKMNQIDQLYRQMMENDVQQVSAIQNYKAELFKETNSAGFYLLANDSTVESNFSSTKEKFTKMFKVLQNAEQDPKAKELLLKMEKAQNRFLQMIELEINLKNDNKQDAFMKLASNVKDAADQFQATVDEAVKNKNKQLMHDQEIVKTEMNNVKFTTLIIGVIALIVGLGVSFIVSFLISRPVNMVSNTLNQLAHGNLTVPEVKVKNKDEIGELAHSLNELLHNQKQLIGKVYESAIQVAASSEELLANNEQNARASEQIAHSVQQTAAGSEKQLVHFEEVSSSVQEMVAGIHQIAESSESMQHSTDKATHLTNDGTMSVQAVVSHMSDINNSFEQTSKIVSLLGSRSQEINGIASLITDIAEQTNLLALNAAIEAARAGEHGKGFAVVADEVRKLAVQSKNSADKIAEMIRFVQDETNQAIEAVKSGNELVEKGLSSSKEANEAFSNISCSINDVSAKVQEVSAAVEELTAQSHTIVQTIGNVKEIAEQGVFASQESSAATQEQVATMEEVTASAHGLTELADELQAAVSQFKL
ncbi:MAG TPA: methyl-accepting chemotaxis protein [Bacillales bacterium]|nr:methyl-accepting chemotaxis protein [Bacillales bacterium]